MSSDKNEASFPSGNTEAAKDRERTLEIQGQGARGQQSFGPHEVLLTFPIVFRHCAATQFLSTLAGRPLPQSQIRGRPCYD